MDDLDDADGQAIQNAFDELREDFDRDVDEIASQVGKAVANARK